MDFIEIVNDDSRYTYGAILQQGGTMLPEADSGKLTVLSWYYPNHESLK